MYAEDAGLRLARSEASVDELLAQTELEREVVELLLELKEPTRGTLILRFQGGLTAAEIARRTGVPQGTVRRRMMDGLNLLRDRMDARHGERGAWAPALVGVAPGALKAALVSSGSGLAAGAALMSMKKLMWLAATVLILGIGWLTRSTWLGHPGSTPDQTLALESEFSSPAPSAAAVPAATQPKASARESLAIPAPIEEKSAPSFKVVDHSGEPIDSATIMAVVAGERQALTSQGAGRFVLDDDGAKALQDRASVPLVVSRSGGWPHTFEGLLTPGEHTLVWPRGVTLKGQLLENGQRPGEPVRLSLKRDVGWSGRPHAAAIDDRWDPIPRSVVADADGSFLLADLPPGWRGWLKIEDSWRFATQSRQSEAVSAEGPSSVVFSILRSPRVTGRVIASPSGEGVADHTVRVDSTHPGEATYITETTTDADGRFTWIPWPGATSAEFRFGANGDFRTLTLPDIELPNSGKLDLGEIVLEPMTKARILVTDSAGKPVSNASVKESGTQTAAVSDSDGLMSIPVQNLDAAVLEVRAEGYERADYSVQGLSMDTATELALRPELRLSLRVLDSEGQPRADSQVLFVPVTSPPGGLDLFRLQDRDLVAGTVTRYSQFADRRKVIGITTDADGRIEFGGLSRDLSMQIGFMERQDWIEAPLVASADAQGRWEGTLYDRRETFPRVEGVVTTAAGAPISDANVKFPSSLMASYVRTDEQGRFSAPVGWKKGASHLIVSSPGFARVRHPLLLSSLTPEPLRLTLEKERTLVVQAVDPSGAPMPESDISVSTKRSDGRWNYFDSGPTNFEGQRTFNQLPSVGLRLTARINDVSYRTEVPADATNYAWQIDPPATITVDWSGLLEAGIDPRFVILRQPQIQGEGFYERLSDDRVDGFAAEENPGVRSAQFQCAPGQFEAVAIRGASKEQMEVVASIMFEVEPGQARALQLTPAGEDEKR
jgi:hypothetical protein